MAIQKSQAILLSKRDIRETSCVVNFYTEGFGKIKGLIKNVRGPQAKFGIYLHEFGKYDIVYYEKRRQETYMVTQCDLKDAYEEIAGNLYKRLNGYYILELTDRFTPVEEKSADIYNLLNWVLDVMRRQRFIGKVIIIYQLKFLEYIGFLPLLDFCQACSNKSLKDYYFSTRLGGLLCSDCRSQDIQVIEVSKGTVVTINQIRRYGISQLNRLTISNDIAKELTRLLERFVAYHLGEHLRSRDVIKQAVETGTIPEQQIAN